MASLTPTPFMQFMDANGEPLVGGKLYTYAAGTTTPLATYTDATGSTPNTNPIILNTLGSAAVWCGTQQYAFTLKTSTDVLVWTADNIGDSYFEVQSWCGVAGGTANALTLTPNVTCAGYVAGQIFRFKSGASANTGPATVSVSGLPIKTIQYQGVALDANMIAANNWFSVLYDGGNFQLVPYSVVRVDVGVTPTGQTLTLPYLDGSLINAGVGGISTLSTTAGPVAYMEKWGGNVTMVPTKVDNTLSAAYFSKGTLTSGGAVASMGTMWKYGDGGDGIAVAGHAWSASSTSTSVFGGWFVAGITDAANTAAYAFGIEIDIDNASHDAGYMFYPTAGATVGLWINNSSAGTPTAPSSMAIGITYGEPYRWYTGLSVGWNSIKPEINDPTIVGLQVGEAIMLQGSSVPTAAAGIRLRNYHTKGIDFGGSLMSIGIDFARSVMTDCAVRFGNSQGLWSANYAQTANLNLLYLNTFDGLVLGDTAVSVSVTPVLYANGGIVTTNTTLTAAAAATSSGNVSLGKSTSGTAGAVVGYLDIYIGSTAYKIPYHAV